MVLSPERAHEPPYAAAGASPMTHARHMTHFTRSQHGTTIGVSRQRRSAPRVAAGRAHQALESALRTTQGKPEEISACCNCRRTHLRLPCPLVQRASPDSDTTRRRLAPDPCRSQRRMHNNSAKPSLPTSLITIVSVTISQSLQLQRYIMHR